MMALRKCLFFFSNKNFLRKFLFSVTDFIALPNKNQNKTFICFTTIPRKLMGVQKIPSWKKIFFFQSETLNVPNALQGL